MGNARRGRLVVGTCTALLLLGAVGHAGCGSGGNGDQPGGASPTASFSTSIDGLTVDVDASGCSDAEDAAADLQVRWDWTNDGAWDTGWTTTKTASHGYASAGTYTLALEVRDSDGQEDGAETDVVVSTPPWVKTVNGSLEEDVTSIAAFPDGSTVIAGQFSGVATFGPGEGNETQLTAAAGADPYVADIHIARYDPSGRLLWARRAGGAESDGASGVAVLSDGSAVVTGTFRGTATFGAGEGNETQLTSAGSEDAFLARYQPDGTLAWARRDGGSAGEEPRDVATHTDGSIAIVGQFGGIATFGAGETNETELTALVDVDPTRDVFVARYTPDGALTWARRDGGTGYDSGLGVAWRSDGSIVATGGFRGTAVFGAGEVEETPLSSDGDSDVFLAAYDATGTLVWAKRAGGAESQVAADVASVPGGSAVLVTGLLWGDATFGPGEGAETELTVDGQWGIFLARYDADGALVWARKALADAWDGAPALDVLPNGAAVVTGNFEGSATFAPGEIHETGLTSAGQEDVFLARYDPDGALVWVKRAGGSEDDGGRAVVVLADGSPVVAGTYSDTATFAPGEAGETQRTAIGTEEDVFLAKYDPDGTL